MNHRFGRYARSAALRCRSRRRRSRRPASATGRSGRGLGRRDRDAGVDIDEADRAVGAIRKLARATFTPGVLTDIGTFGASYGLAGWKNPVLVSSADGVGTKLKIAFLTGRHDTVGEDLVNHCV